MKNQVLSVLSISFGLAAFARPTAFYLPGPVYATPGLECNVYWR